MTISTNGNRLFIARHGETIFNLVGRMQGMDAHTPLTWDGCVQATMMGRALATHVDKDAPLKLLASPSGRTLQTLALIVQQTGHDWHTHQTDTRLREIDIGAWEGRFYTEIAEEVGNFVDMEHHLFSCIAPEGESYPQIAERLHQWISEQDFAQDILIISHGMTARVLRGILRGLEPLAAYGTPIAPSLSQGSMVMICNGEEELIVSGDGSGEKA